MRPFTLGTPPVDQGNEAKIDWIIQSLQEIERASQVNNDILFDAFDLSNVTEVRSLDADSTTLAEVADLLGTLIADFKDREI